MTATKEYIQNKLEKKDTLIFRYRSFNEFALEEIANSQLYFSSLADFNDPFDVAPLISSGLTKLTDDQLRNEINLQGFACFCCSRENLHMWSHYGNGLKGFCLAYDGEQLFNSLKKNLMPAQQIELLKVKYARIQLRSAPLAH